MLLHSIVISSQYSAMHKFVGVLVNPRQFEKAAFTILATWRQSGNTDKSAVRGLHFLPPFNLVNF